MGNEYDYIGAYPQLCAARDDCKAKIEQWRAYEDEVQDAQAKVGMVKFTEATQKLIANIEACISLYVDMLGQDEDGEKMSDGFLTIYAAINQAKVLKEFQGA